jgi:hypothetical protein
VWLWEIKVQATRKKENPKKVNKFVVSSIFPVPQSEERVFYEGFSGARIVHA